MEEFLVLFQESFLILFELFDHCFLNFVSAFFRVRKFGLFGSISTLFLFHEVFKVNFLLFLYLDKFLKLGLLSLSFGDFGCSLLKMLLLLEELFLAFGFFHIF